RRNPYREVGSDVKLARAIALGRVQRDRRQRYLVGNKRVIGQDRRGKKTVAGKAVCARLGGGQERQARSCKPAEKIAVHDRYSPTDGRGRSTIWAIRQKQSKSGHPGWGSARVIDGSACARFVTGCVQDKALAVKASGKRQSCGDRDSK